MYCEGATVKRFKDALEEMKTIYNYEDEKTSICMIDQKSFAPNTVSIATVDEKTEIGIMMSKRLKK